MAAPKKEVKPTPVKRVSSPTVKKSQPKVSETKKIETKSTLVAKKTTKPVAKAEEKKPIKVETKKPVTKIVVKKEPTKPVKKVEVKKEEPKKEVVKASAKKPAAKRVDVTKPVVATAPQPKTTGKTVYHVTKREKDGREWKVFIQGSNKVIKLFGTQVEALDFAKGLCLSKNDGSYVLLHGLDGKIRKY